MIWPGNISWPPYSLTPRCLAFESFLFFVLPADFFVAHRLVSMFIQFSADIHVDVDGSAAGHSVMATMCGAVAPALTELSANRQGVQGLELILNAHIAYYVSHMRSCCQLLTKDCCQALPQGDSYSARVKALYHSSKHG
jgi:hypothetical protein